jgi:hypothetical protein
MHLPKAANAASQKVGEDSSESATEGAASRVRPPGIKV